MPENTSRWRWVTFLMITALLLMILFRLIWLQRRQYQPDLEMRTMIGAEVLLRENITICNNVKNIVSLWPRIRSQQSDASDRNLLAWYSSPGARYLIRRFHCRNDEGGEQHFIENNQKLLIAAVFFCALAARFMTGSWMATLIVATVLLSRGRALTEIGNLSLLLWIKGLLALWFALLVHHLRTASLTSLTGAIIILSVLTCLERSFLGIFLLFPLCFSLLWVAKFLLNRPFVVRLKVQRRVALAEARRSLDSKEGASPPLRQGALHPDWMELRFFARFVTLMGFIPDTLDDVGDDGGLLNPLRSPYFVWLYRHHRIPKFARIHLVFLVLILGVTIGITFGDSIGLAALRHPGRFFSSTLLVDQWILYWIASWLAPIDIDLIIALFVIIFAIVRPWPYSRLYVREISALTLLAIALLSISACGWDALDGLYKANERKSFWLVTSNLTLRASAIFLWWDPIILTLGISGLIHICISFFSPWRMMCMRAYAASRYNKRRKD